MGSHCTAAARSAAAAERGRPRVPDRACFTGILFVSAQRHSVQMLLRELGCG